MSTASHHLSEADIAVRRHAFKSAVLVRAFLTSKLGQQLNDVWWNRQDADPSRPMGKKAKWRDVDPADKTWITWAKATYGEVPDETTSPVRRLGDGWEVDIANLEFVHFPLRHLNSNLIAAQDAVQLVLHARFGPRAPHLFGPAIHASWAKRSLDADSELLTEYHKLTTQMQEFDVNIAAAGKSFTGTFFIAMGELLEGRMPTGDFGDPELVRVARFAAHDLNYAIALALHQTWQEEVAKSGVETRWFPALGDPVVAANTDSRLVRSANADVETNIRSLDLLQLPQLVRDENLLHGRNLAARVFWQYLDGGPITERTITEFTEKMHEDGRAFRRVHRMPIRPEYDKPYAELPADKIALMKKMVRNGVSSVEQFMLAVADYRAGDLPFTPDIVDSMAIDHRVAELAADPNFAMPTTVGVERAAS